MVRFALEIALSTLSPLALSPLALSPLALSPLALSPLAVCSPVHGTHGAPVVKTSAFAVQGTIWPNNSAVNFFGNFPYAEPPVGELRFRPPVTKAPMSELINGSWFGPSCIQYSNGQPTVYTEYLNGFLLTPGQPTSEGCLTVNVWTPKNASQSEKLPVMIWIHGGGFTSGGAASPYKYGDRLAADQNVIVVAMNYRLNIFGFPAAEALNGRNLNPGLMDVRKAVEWTYNHIHAFGADPEQMTLFGQSAGGMSVDMYSYAYPFDPLVKAFIPHSGVAPNETYDPLGFIFTYVASQVGCGNTTSADAEFECMQKADARSIIHVYNEYNATLNGGKSLSFGPSADNQTAFSDYADLQNRGLFARLPTLYAQVNDEGTSLVTYHEAGINQTAADATTASLATCPGNTAAAAKASFGVPVWRTRYFGVWPNNLNPLSWLGSYHSSDLPMVFGTSDLLAPDTPAEEATSKYMQSAWAAFAKDPVNGLKAYGWPMYERSAAKTLVELGGVKGSSTAVLVAGDAFDGMC